MSSPHKKIETRLLEINREEQKFCQNIKEEFLLFSVNTRPDAELLELRGEPRLQISLRGHPTALFLTNGQVVYFNPEPPLSSFQEWNGPKAPLTISSLPTPWSIIPIVLKDEVFVQINAGPETENCLFSFKEEDLSSRQEIAKHLEWLKSLRTAKFWMLDLFAPRFTPSTAQAQAKLKFELQTAEKIIPVSQNDFLFFASGEWQKGSLEFALGRPLMKITAINSEEVEATVWDDSGFFREKVVISPLIVAPYSFVKLDSLFSSLKQRNSTEVSCTMGKKRVVLKPEAWWIKSPKGWRRLKSRTEIDDYLSYRLLGELVVIEAVESFQGRCTITGRQLDPLRILEQSFSMQIAESAWKPKNMLPNGVQSFEKRGDRSRS